MAVQDINGLPVTAAEICPRCGIYVHDIHLCNVPIVTVCGVDPSDEKTHRALEDLARAAVRRMKKER